MSRTLKRVPLDFDWPRNVVWGGYINPFSSQATKCPACENGYSPEAKQLQDRWYGYVDFQPEDRGSTPFLPGDPLIVELARRNCQRGRFAENVQTEAKRLCNLFNKAWVHHLNQDDVNALVAADRLYDFTHTWTKESGWTKKDPPYVPIAEEVNRWSLRGLGHDSCNCWVVIKAECARLGYQTECARCRGSGHIWPTVEIERLADEWKQVEPPVGGGYQLWETTSEGSPQSPVFESLDALCEWAAEHATTFGSSRTSAAEWQRMLQDNFVYHEEGNCVFM